MFAELLACSCFSFLRGASHPEEIVGRAKELGFSAVGLCDRDGLYGSARAFLAAREIEQRVIVGAELTVGLGPRPVRARSASRKAPRDVDERPTLALLVENRTGYGNLCRLLTRAHADLPKGESLLDLAWLPEHAAGLTAIVPAPRCPGD